MNTRVPAHRFFNMPGSNQHTHTHCHTVSNGQGFLRPSCLLLVTAPYMEACGPRCMIAHHLVAEATQLCTTVTANQILSFLVCGRMGTPYGLATLVVRSSANGSETARSLGKEDGDSYRWSQTRSRVGNGCIRLDVGQQLDVSYVDESRR
jgi:hypothetical protein